MILIVDQTQKSGNTYAEIFHYMGVLSYAVTPEKAVAEIDLRYRAILVIKPETIPGYSDLPERLAAVAKRIPVFAISNEQDVPKFYKTFPENIFSSRLLREISAFAKECSLPVPGDYRLAGIDASADLSGVLVFGRPLPLTKTEAMILRALIRSYPVPLDSRSVMKYAYRPSRVPEFSNVRTHISVINKKSREILGRNLIGMHEREGYVILTPELAYAK